MSQAVKPQVCSSSRKRFCAPLSVSSFFLVLWVGVLVHLVAQSSLLHASSPASPPSTKRHNVLPRATHETTRTHQIFIPLVEHQDVPSTSDDISADFIDIRVREVSRAFYLQQYLPLEETQTTQTSWVGDRETCDAGYTTPEFRAAVLRRINYFRAMAGIPLVQLRDEYNQKAQKAALMMSMNRDLSHSPPGDWVCYSDEGYEAAGSSNLFLGVMGWDAITGYILEGGAVGHRRWILYPRTQAMGTGDIPGTVYYPAANALWVFDNLGGIRPDTRDGFVAWPPPGYVPYQVVNDHWSFSYAHADFSNATVTMMSQGVQIPVELEPIHNGYGENTLVWIPLGTGDTHGWPKPEDDEHYHVEIRNVVMGEEIRNFSYDVVVFDPMR